MGFYKKYFLHNVGIIKTLRTLEKHSQSLVLTGRQAKHGKISYVCQCFFQDMFSKFEHRLAVYTACT